jgi:hypothetical protein
VDDGIDQDGDGDTNDDDPTNIQVVVFQYPMILTEDFSDDLAGINANQSYMGHEWFETIADDDVGSSFEVAPGYYYSTSKSFKTKLRSTSSTSYWNYSLDQLGGDIEWWETWFACGDTSEESDLYLDFKNINGEDIAKLKFKYVNNGTELPDIWILELYYWDPPSGWIQLYSDFVGGYLHNSWYKIRVEKNGLNHIDYSLNRTGKGLVGFGTGNQLSASFSNFARVEFSSNKNPVVCPMYFWDEHTICLMAIS